MTAASTWFQRASTPASSSASTSRRTWWPFASLPDLRPAIVGAPAYFDVHAKPTAPRDVLQHRCIGFRHRGESKYRWEFDKGAESLAIAVSGSLERR